MIHAECTYERNRATFWLRDLPREFHAAARDLGFIASGPDYARTVVAASPNLETICANFRRAAPDLIHQTAGLLAVPWEATLDACMKRLHGKPIHWFLAGSAALAIRGIAVTPRDVDFVTDDAGAQRLGDLFADRLIQPVAAVEAWIARWFGRAWLGARVEWVGGIEPHLDVPEPGDFGPAAAARLETVRWDTYDIRVPPLDLQRAVSERRGLMERVAAIDRYLAEYAA